MDECPICLDPCDEEQGIVTQCCKKYFHETCFDKCIQLNGRCPTCRKAYTPVLVEVSVGMSWRPCIPLCLGTLVIVTFIASIAYTSVNKV
jgi:hypothetical protein